MADVKKIGSKVLGYFFALLPTFITTAEKVGVDIAGADKKQAVTDALFGIADAVASASPQHATAAHDAAAGAEKLIDTTVAVMNDTGILRGADTVIITPPSVPAALTSAAQKATTDAVKGDEVKVDKPAATALTTDAPPPPPPPPPPPTTAAAAGASTTTADAGAAGSQTATVDNSAEITTLRAQITQAQARIDALTARQSGTTGNVGDQTTQDTSSKQATNTVAFRQG